ncbi:MAG: SusD/RagB family nutrient-binding outer membrane lipoprotein [Flavobacteriaceae bacterium]|nr:SusD/RagB family nutrient-binding outer membrane lipoprotein [Flavobacteriaceae bacterium]
MNISKITHYIPKYLYFIFFLVVVFTFSRCTKDFAKINTNPYSLSTDVLVDSPVLQGQALAQAQYTQMNGLHWRFQISQNLFSDLWAGYYATTAVGFDSDRFTQVGRWAGLAWGSFYEVSAPQIKLVEDLAAENGNAVGEAIAKIVKVNGYHRITDYWGPVPYSQFGNQELTVPYDSQEEIYKDLFKNLDEASSALSGGGVSYAASDRIYGGDGAKWRKLAESLRLRLALRVRYVDPALSRSEAEKAFNSGALITDPADNAFVAADDKNRNPLETITDWGEFRMSANMESILKGYQDPRLQSFFDPANDGDSDGDGNPYEGLQNGQTKVALGDSKNNNHSDINVKYRDVANGGENPPIPVFQASETHFLLAEAALAGYSVGGTAEQYYNSGIATSMKETTGASDADIEAYTKSTNTPVSFDGGVTPPVTDIPVLFDSSDDERGFEQIITQKWIALFPNGWEAWAEARRTGYPRQYPRVATENADVPVDQIPRRMVYVEPEYTTNEEAVTEAVSSKLGGADKNNVKLWWDKK